MNDSKQYGCPVEVTVDVIGGKWKCTILWWLRRSAKRFGELMQLIPRISRKVLTNQLRELERDGLIERQTYPESPPRVEYSLTSLGETLEPITDLMCDWGKAQVPGFNFGLLDLSGLNILLVSEDSNSREQLRIELETIRGAEVNTASIVAFIERQPQVEPDVVIIDLSHRLLRRKTTKPAVIVGEVETSLNSLSDRVRLLATELNKSIPAIALADRVETRTQGFADGFGLILTKPVEPSELVAAIGNVTGKLTTEG